MSEPRIALVAEGPTDYEVISAVLRAVLDRPFVLTMVQPEATRPEFGGGWGGVLKWCYQVAQSGCASLDSCPLLTGFDLVIIHVDADIASMNYGDCGPEVADLAARKRWRNLPCELSCPPPLQTVEWLENSIAGWLGGTAVGKKTIFCIPSKSTGTWLAFACLPEAHSVLAGGECDLELERKLPSLKLDERIKKTTAQYRAKALLITQNWDKVKAGCSIALRFETLVQSYARNTNNGKSHA
jgi:hypothetical protein